MNRCKESQCSVRTKNTDSKVHGNFKLVQARKLGCVDDSGTAFMIFLEVFVGKKEKNISFKCLKSCYKTTTIKANKTTTKRIVVLRVRVELTTLALTAPRSAD